MQARSILRAVAAILSIVAVALALMGAAPQPQPDATTATPMVGVPTGEYVDGVPVHRLPSVNVTARRSDAR